MANKLNYFFILALCFSCSCVYVFSISCIWSFCFPCSFLVVIFALLRFSCFIWSIVDIVWTYAYSRATAAVDRSWTAVSCTLHLTAKKSRRSALRRSRLSSTGVSSYLALLLSVWVSVFFSTVVTLLFSYLFASVWPCRWRLTLAF